MKTKRQLIEDTCILICKHNDLIREIQPIIKKIFDTVDESLVDSIKELSLSKYLSIFATSKKAYIGECGNEILDKVNKLKKIKEDLQQWAQ